MRKRIVVVDLRDSYRNDPLGLYLERGRYKLKIPADYDPFAIDAEDVLRDPQIEKVSYQGPSRRADRGV